MISAEEAIELLQRSSVTGDWRMRGTQLVSEWDVERTSGCLVLAEVFLEDPALIVAAPALAATVIALYERLGHTGWGSEESGIPAVRSVGGHAMSKEIVGWICSKCRHLMEDKPTRCPECWGTVYEPVLEIIVSPNRWKQALTGQEP